MIKVGEKAPDFALEDQDGEIVRLSDLKGKKVLISWHPLAWTGICTDQMRSLEREYDRLEDAGVDVVLGLSVDAQPAKSVWAAALSLEKVRILADFEPKGEMSKAYGVYSDEMGASIRAAVLVDEEGNIAGAKEYEMSELPDIEETIKNVSQL